MIEYLSSPYPDLFYIPKFINQAYNDLDGFQEYDHYVMQLDGKLSLYSGPIDFTTDNQNILKSILENNNFYHIVEIGIARDLQSSTDIILKNRKNAQYIGIDIRDGSFIKDENAGIFTLQGKSLDPNIIEQTRQICNNSIDLLIIDGDHSINTVVSEIINYGSMVRPGGYIVMHDISHHPGPREVFKAINTQRFEKFAYCQHDYGLGVLRRKT